MSEQTKSKKQKKHEHSETVPEDHVEQDESSEVKAEHVEHIDPTPQGESDVESEAEAEHPDEINADEIVTEQVPMVSSIHNDWSPHNAEIDHENYDNLDTGNEGAPSERKPFRKSMIRDVTRQSFVGENAPTKSFSTHAVQCACSRKYSRYDKKCEGCGQPNTLYVPADDTKEDHQRHIDTGKEDKKCSRCVIL